MAVSIPKNRVGMTVTGTPGTGTITLNAADTGYQSFATAYGTNANVDVLIVEGSAWEVARDCTYTHSGTTLSRGTLEASSTGSALSLTSAAKVYVTETASRVQSMIGAANAITPGGRLTLTTGVPVTTSDVTDATTVYYTPYLHNVISLWNGADWVPTVFAETSLALGTLTSGKPYDVFGYLSSGVLALELLAWTDDDARATDVSIEGGRVCKSGDKTRLLLGTLYTSSTTATVDSETKRFLCNLYNRASKRCRGNTTASHTYTTGATREWNAGTSVTRGEFVNTLDTYVVPLSLNTSFSQSSGSTMGHVGVALNSTTSLGDVHGIMVKGQSGALEFRGGQPRLEACKIGKNFITATQYGISNVTYSSAYFSGAVSV